MNVGIHKFYRQCASVSAILLKDNNSETLSIWHLYVPLKMLLHGTNKVPFFRHSVYLTPFSPDTLAHIVTRSQAWPLHALFHTGDPENIFTTVPGTNALICAENRPRPKSRVAIKALVARLSVFPTCSDLLPFVHPLSVLSSLSWRYVNVTSTVSTAWQLSFTFLIEIVWSEIFIYIDVFEKLGSSLEYGGKSGLLIIRASK